jgi:hypothetical protein
MPSPPSLSLNLPDLCNQSGSRESSIHADFSATASRRFRLPLAVAGGTVETESDTERPSRTRSGYRPTWAQMPALVQ